MITLYHGTSEENARKIMSIGFRAGMPANWPIKSKPHLVYLSSAYAPFYAMRAAKGDRLALIKVRVSERALYPEDDFIMCFLGKANYTQAELDQVNIQKFKHLWPQSLKFMGNAAAQPEHIKIVGVRYFDGKNLLMRCDPVVSPINFLVMGDYYKELTEWIFSGRKIEDFKKDFIVNANQKNGG